MKKQKVQAKINLEALAGGAFAEKLNEGRGGAPAFKLVAADGGLWKSQAVDNVKNYLVKALADVPDREKITIIA